MTDPELIARAAAAALAGTSDRGKRLRVVTAAAAYAGALAAFRATDTPDASNRAGDVLAALQPELHALVGVLTETEDNPPAA